MVARSAADDVDVVDGVDVIVVEREAVEEHVAVLDGTADSVAHGTRLFEDFLEHEIGEAAALGVFGIPIDMRGLEPVSYTHLDVYKRQGIDITRHEPGFLEQEGGPCEQDLVGLPRRIDLT